MRSTMAGARSCYRLLMTVDRGEKISQVGCILGPAEEVPLSVRAAFNSQNFKLIPRLDAFRGRHYSQAAAQADNGAEYRQTVLVFR